MAKKKTASKPSDIMWRVHYYDSDDSFHIQTSTDFGETWDLVRCQQCIDGQLLHYEMLTQIRELCQMGYTPYKGKW